MQQHQLDGGAGLTGKASAEAAVGSLVIQLPSTSANQMGNQVQQQHNQASSQQSSHQQAYPMSYRNHGDHQPLATGEQNWTTALACARDTNSPVYTQARTNNDMRYSCCHHQAATRDIMLKNHQQTSNRNKYWRRNGSNSNSTRATTGTNASLLSNEANDTTDPSQQHSNASITIPTNTPATTVTTTATLGSTSSGNENDNISDDSIPPPPNYHEIPGIVPSYHGRTSGPPPAYDDVVNPNAPPPSYQSLFGQVREARKSSNGLVDLLRQLFLVLIGTIGCTMIIGFLLLIPITMIFVGFFYINECRAENIPAFLVVGGFVWIIKNMLNCYNQFKKDSTVNRPPPRRGPHLSVAVAAGSTTTVPMTTTATTSNNTTAGSNQEHRQEVVLTGNHTMSTSVAIPANEQSLTASLTTQTQVTTSTTINTTGASAGTQQNPNGSSTISSSQQHSHHNHHHHHHGHVRQPQMIGLTSDKWESVLNYFLIVWFLASCIVVYRIYEPDYDNPLSLSYCNRTVYLYAFWLMTSAFIIMAIVLSCLCCLMASSLMSCSHGR